MTSKYLTPNESVSKDDNCKDSIFNSREEMKQSLSRLCYGNLHVIGSIWIEGVKSALIGTKMCLVPRVEAAPPKKDEGPQKPPKMKYKELPLYECPHLEYKQHLEDEQFKSLQENPKILQCMFTPTVRAWRKAVCDNISDGAEFLQECACEMKELVKAQKKCFMHCMRKEDNLCMRQAVVLIGTSAAFVISARRTHLLYQRAFWTSVGAVSTGWLCFPKDTDVRIRQVGDKVHQLMKKLHEVWYGPVILPVIAPCGKDIPPCPKKEKEDPKHVCPKKPPPAAQKPPPKK